MLFVAFSLHLSPPFFFIAIPEQLLFRIAINSYSYNPTIQKSWGAFTKIPHVFPLLFGPCNVHLKHPSYPESLYCRCFQHCLEEEGEGSSQSSVTYAEQLTYAKCFSNIYIILHVFLLGVPRTSGQDCC